MDKKVPDTSAFVKKTDYSSKITKIENKISIITGSTTNSALTAVENKISNGSGLVKKKQTITQKLVKLKVKLIIIIMTNTLLLQSLII